VLIVAGHLELDAADRDAHVQASAGTVRLARRAPGCLDFAVSADPVDPSRVNILERWASPEDLEAFRNSGDEPDTEPVDFERILNFDIEHYTVSVSVT
jgi:quinol monooxygenase YgiN